MLEFQHLAKSLVACLPDEEQELVRYRSDALERAAPEMLAILEELRESSTCCGTYDLLDETTWASPDLADRIEAAIKKARGEE